MTPDYDTLEWRDCKSRKHCYTGKPYIRQNPLRRKHRSKIEDAPFLAWDGEGYTDEHGKHHYMLFGNSSNEYVQSSSLDWKDCFPLLLKHPNEINVIYGGDYDIIKMIQTMPIGRRKRIMKGLQTVYEDYSIRWIRRKMLRIRQRSTGLSATLYDVLPYFQTSFVNACREYLGNDETLEAMHEMKLKRDSFTLDDDKVIPYWQSELQYLTKLMTLFRELLAEVDIMPSRGWYGPGTLANRLMSSHAMRQYYGNVPAIITDLAERAYYGGRFEQFKIGQFQSAYEYDIRSAYPSAIAQLPDFSTATWKHREYDNNPDSINPFGLYNVSWLIHDTGRSAGPFPWRNDKGSIYFPLRGHQSWYWGVEVQAAMKEYSPWIDITESWIPTLTNVKPFSWVPEMYDRRAKMRAEDNPAQKGLKLGLNSIYGKVAQSIGAMEDEYGVWTKPTWHHALWAGWITACTRASIFQAIGSRPEILIAIETDAVFVTEPIETLSVGEALGQWELTSLDRILYIQSGVYHAVKDGGALKIKSRGIESSYVQNEDYWLDIFRKLPYEEVQISTTARRFGTDLRQPWRFGQWYDQTFTKVMPNMIGKRVHVPVRCNACKRRETYADHFHDLIPPQPFITSDTESSTPYKFPWRSDAKYESKDYAKGEHIESIGNVEWRTL